MLLVSTLLIQPFWVVLLFQSFAIDLHSATLLSSRFVHDTQGRSFILNQFFEKCLAAPDAERKCVSSPLWLVCYKQAVYSSSSSHYLRVQRMTASGKAPDIFNHLILDGADSAEKKSGGWISNPRPTQGYAIIGQTYVLICSLHH